MWFYLFRRKVQYCFSISTLSCEGICDQMDHDAGNFSRAKILAREKGVLVEGFAGISAVWWMKCRFRKRSLRDLGLQTAGSVWYFIVLLSCICRERAILLLETHIWITRRKGKNGRIWRLKSTPELLLALRTNIHYEQESPSSTTDRL